MCVYMERMKNGTYMDFELTMHVLNNHVIKQKCNNHISSDKDKNL